MRNPSFNLERIYGIGYQIVVGVDEVGRGALAGPVVAATVSLCPVLKPILGRRPKDSQKTRSLDFWTRLGIDDSKKLSSKRRERLSKIIKKYGLWGVGEVEVAYINKHGIAKATAKAMRQAVAMVKLRAGREKRAFVLVDHFHVKYIPGVGLKNQKGIVRGDQKSLSIAAASIVAKVHRDRLMVKLHRKYPQYRWRENKGYGTADHLRAIKKHGVTRWHRKLFVRKYVNNLHW